MADILDYLNRYSKVLEQALAVIERPPRLGEDRRATELLMALAQNQEHINSLVLDKLDNLERSTTR